MPRAAVRSKAWGVLAVSLALMALVAARSSTTARTLSPSRTRARSVEPPVVSPQASPRVRAADATSATAGSVPTTGIGAGSAAIAPPAGSTATVTSSPPASPAAVGTPAAAATTGSSTGISPAADESSGSQAAEPEISSVPMPYPGPGNFQPPTASAAFTAAGGGTVTASATWSGTPTLVLSIACPGGPSSSRSGTSGLSIAVDDDGASTNCQVTIALPTGVSATVEYTLVVAPRPVAHPAGTG